MILTREQQKAIRAWCVWYSGRLDRIAKALENKTHKTGDGEDYSGYEQDLYEAFGCAVEPQDLSFRRFKVIDNARLRVELVSSDGTARCEAPAEDGNVCGRPATTTRAISHQDADGNGVVGNLCEVHAAQLASAGHVSGGMVAK